MKMPDYFKLTKYISANKQQNASGANIFIVFLRFTINHKNKRA